jgi:hypothetical protein
VDKNIAALICASVVTCVGLVAFCIRPTEGPVILGVVSPLVTLCGTAWQANRSQKQPGS